MASFPAPLAMVLAVTLLLGCSSSAESPLEEPPSSWGTWSGSSTVAVREKVLTGPQAGARGYRVKGTTGDRVFARTPVLPGAFQEGQRVRVTVPVRVESFTPVEAGPMLRLRFARRGADGEWDLEADPGSVVTLPWDPRAPGWQTLGRDFLWPADAEGAWASLVVLDDEKITLDLEVGPVAMEPVAETPWVPTSLPPHPRLLDVERRVERIQAWRSDKLVSMYLNQLKTRTERSMGEDLRQPGRANPSIADEELDKVRVSAFVPGLALLYKLTGDRRYLSRAQDAMEAACDLPTWGRGKYDGVDLAAGQHLYNLSVGYDWLHPDLEPGVREAVQTCLVGRAGNLHDRLLRGDVWWADTVMHNHAIVGTAGLAMATLALLGDRPEAARWVPLVEDQVQRIVDAMGPDGACHEGPAYWGFRLDFLLGTLEAVHQVLGVDHFARSSALRQTASFRIWSSVPERSWSRTSTLLNLADGPFADTDGPDYLLFHLASRYRDGYAQALGQAMARSGNVGSIDAGVRALLWYDPSLEPRSLSELPRIKAFEDLGLVVLRSGWAGGESVLLFRSGAPAGRAAQDRFSLDAGLGHVHPGVGAVQLFAHGERLLTGGGATVKDPAYENTLSLIHI